MFKYSRSLADSFCISQLLNKISVKPILFYAKQRFTLQYKSRSGLSKSF